MHKGQPGVVAEDGTEPGPISIPSMSGGGDLGTITEWWGSTAKWAARPPHTCEVRARAAGGVDDEADGQVEGVEPRRSAAGGVLEVDVPVPQPGRPTIDGQGGLGHAR